MPGLTLSAFGSGRPPRAAPAEAGVETPQLGVDFPSSIFSRHRGLAASPRSCSRLAMANERLARDVARSRPPWRPLAGLPHASPRLAPRPPLSRPAPGGPAPHDHGLARTRVVRL